MDEIETDPEVQSGGETLLGNVETIGLNALKQVEGAASDAINQGRMPYDPANGDFGAVRPPQGQTKSFSLFGLVILFLIGKAIFK